MSTIARDLPPGNAPFQIAPPEFEFPFQQNGDDSTFTVTRFFKQSLQGYLSTRQHFLCDADYPQCYLIRESPATRTTTAMVTFSRTFSTIPKQQSVPSSIFVTKPDIPGTFPQTFGSLVITQPVSTVASYDIYSPQTVTGDSGAISVAATGGTYTLTFAGSTTGALNYNDSAGTVQTALNALTPVSNRGSVTVSGAYTTGFGVTFGSYAAATVSTGSLTTSGTIASSIVTSNGGYTQAVSITTQAQASPSVSANTNGLTTAYSSGGASNGALAYTFPNYANTGKTLVQITGPSISGGSFTITINGQTTSAISFTGLTAATITTALSGIGSYTASGLTYNYTGYTGSDIVQFQFSIAGSAGVGTITAGTYTITIAGGTTAALAYNASTATIQAALNAIAGVSNRGNCTVSGTGLASDALSITFTIAFANAAITGTSSLTPSGAVIASALSDTVGRIQSLTIGTGYSTRTLTVPSHGIVAGDVLVVSNGTSYYDGVTNFSVPDVNTILLVATGSESWAALSSITKCGKRTKAGYAPGLSLTRCSRVTDFYLPGVSAGITTVADIPLPTFQGSPSALLAAIFNGNETINFEVGELHQWRDSQILARTTTVLNAALL